MPKRCATDPPEQNESNLNHKKMKAAAHPLKGGVLKSGREMVETSRVAAHPAQTYCAGHANGNIFYPPNSEVARAAGQSSQTILPPQAVYPSTRFVNQASLVHHPLQYYPQPGRVALRGYCERVLQASHAAFPHQTFRYHNISRQQRPLHCTALQAATTAAASQLSSRGETVTARASLVKPPQQAQSSRNVDVHRRWEDVPDMKGTFAGSGRGSHGSTEFRVLSYNVLAQDLAMEHRYLYGDIKNDLLDWGSRRERLISEISSPSKLSDIICLQEVQKDHYHNFWKPRLNAIGFTGKFTCKTGTTAVDGCAIFFMSEKFVLLKDECVKYFKQGCQLMDRNNIGQVVLLQAKNETKSELGIQATYGGYVCVANTHLLFNKSRGDVKLAQLAKLLAHTHRMSDNNKHPVIFCGDLNSHPDSPLHDFIVEARLRYIGLQRGQISGQAGVNKKGREEFQRTIFPQDFGTTTDCKLTQNKLEHQDGLLTHSHKFKPAYLPYNENLKKVVTSHQRADRTSSMVDHIFYSDDSTKLKLLSRLSLPSPHHVSAAGGIPNEVHASDHFPLCSKFLLRGS